MAFCCKNCDFETIYEIKYVEHLAKGCSSKEKEDSRYTKSIENIANNLKSIIKLTK